MNCLRHPDREAVTSFSDASMGWERRYACKECAEATPGLGYVRAFGTGVGAEAAAEANEAHGNLYVYRDFNDEGKPTGTPEWRNPK